MKTTKLLPLALSLMLFAPAFAADANSTLTVTVDPTTYITTNTASISAASPTVAADFSQLTITGAMTPKFKIYTNEPTEELYLYGSAVGTDGTSTKAMFKSGTDKIGLVFANTAADHIPTKSVIEAAAGASPTIETNPNCFAILFKPAIQAAADTAGGGTVSSTTFNANNVKYELTNGQYDITIPSDLNTLTGTFSTHDTHGTYQAKLILQTDVPS